VRFPAHRAGRTQHGVLWHSRRLRQYRLYSGALTAAGVTHVFEEYDGNHTSRIVQRVGGNLLPFFSEVLLH
jgi:hypothetical protein